MAIAGKIDLHMHSNISDGSDTPEEILMKVKEAGISLFSLTDHDMVNGCRIIRSIRKEGDPVFVTGVEFSCEDEEGKYHILGYGYDPEAEGFAKVIGKGHKFRIEKMHGRLAFLKKAFGFTFTDKEIKKLFELENPGKPHLGNLMVKHGYAKDRGEAIKEFINKKKFPDAHLRPEEAISGILAGGGIPVLAHPVFGDGDQLIMGDDLDARLKRLTELGLQGVEGFYSQFTPKMIREMLALAEKYDLYVTAGSDYHGANKLNALGDTGLVWVDQWPEGLERFLRDVAERPGYCK